MEILGLPLHPLVVHAVVILVPLAALGGIVISAWTAARKRYGWLTVAFAARRRRQHLRRPAGRRGARRHLARGQTEAMQTHIEPGRQPAALGDHPVLRHGWR